MCWLHFMDAKRSGSLFAKEWDGVRGSTQLAGHFPLAAKNICTKFSAKLLAEMFQLLQMERAEDDDKVSEALSLERHHITQRKN